MSYPNIASHFLPDAIACLGDTVIGILRKALLPEYTFSGPSSGKIYDALFSTVAYTFNKV
jgi:hypothetical protein